MEAFIQCSAHISSIFPSSAQVNTHVVPSTRRDIPLATVLSDIPAEHALRASLFHSQDTGHVLLRVLQGGLTVELVSLSYDISPIRFVFPAIVVPNPAVTTFRGQVYLIALTTVGSLFRIHLPFDTDGQFWHEALPRDWCSEWQVKRLGNYEPKLVHVHDAHDVAIASGSGGILRLHTIENEGPGSTIWSETDWKHSNWYSAFLPVISSSNDSPSEIVSLTSASVPTDYLDLFSLSRDRVLRRWSIGKGCQDQIALGSTTSEEEDPLPLLDPRPQKLIQVLGVPTTDFSEESREELRFVLVFVPTPSSPFSGGYFNVVSPGDTRTGEKGQVITKFATSPASIHCNLLDFSVCQNTLFVLWERQGQSMIEMARIESALSAEPTKEPQEAVIWSRARLDQHSELDQSSMDHLLLQPGSLTDKFLQLVLRPGLFSVVTLRAALQEYREHYLSLPGPHPTPLLSTYATLSESIAAIVGCTVELTRDPHTGASLHKQYWNALRRDWEGFVARCKEIERSARWPVCLGVTSHDQVLIFERERMAQCVEEDTPLHLHRLLSAEVDVDPVHYLLGTCWTLRKKLPATLVQRIETETLGILNQEFSFPLLDILTEASNRTFYKNAIDESLDAWVTERLNNIEDFDAEIHTALDVIGGLDKAVKREEDEVELILPPASLEWIRGLATSYLTETIEIRYNLCLALIVLLFLIVDDLQTCDPALLAEVFSVIRGVAMNRYLCRQSAGDLEGRKPIMQSESMTADDVASRLDNMHMSRGGKNPAPSYSLIHQLLSETGHPSRLPAAPHYFLDQIGLLSGETPAHVTRSEVLICERLRLLGYLESARYLLTWLPRTPEVCYTLGRLWIDVGREAEAVLLLQGVGGCFGSDNVLSIDDHEALASVLPSGRFDTECEYYVHVSQLFKARNLVSHQVQFLKLALSVWPEGSELEASVSTWAEIIKGYTELHLYEDAYCALIASPHQDQRHQYVSHLVYKMCEEDALDRLLSMNFRGLVQEVEQSLSFKARNADPRVQPNWSQILYTWYTVRGDYRNAALTMYLHSRKLGLLQGESVPSPNLVKEQVQSLSIAMNSLGLVEGKNSFIIVPSQGSTLPPRKRRKIGGYIPESKFSTGKRNVEVVKLNDMEQEYAHLSANLQLLRRNPSLIVSTLTPWVTVSKLAQEGLFDLAMYTAKSLAVDMTELFQRLASLCLRLAGSPDASLMEVASSDWLLTDKVSSWPGTPADRGWRYLRESLERYDSPETDYSYSQAVLETLLSSDSSSPPPPWLLQAVNEHHPDYLIRLCLRYGNAEEALEHTLQLVKSSTSSWGTTSSKESGSTWLPYTVIDAVLSSTSPTPTPLPPTTATGTTTKTVTVQGEEEGEGDTSLSLGLSLSPRAQKLREALQTEISNRLIRLQKHCEMSVSVSR